VSHMSTSSFTSIAEATWASLAHVAPGLTRVPSCALPAEALQKMSMMASTSLSVSGRESCSLYGCSDSITWGGLGGDCRGGCSPFPTSRRCTSLTSRRWAATPPSCSSCSEADVTMIGMPPPHRALSVSAAAPPCGAGPGVVVPPSAESVASAGCGAGGKNWPPRVTDRLFLEAV